MDKQMIIDALEDPGIIERALSRREAVKRSGLLGAALTALSVPAAMTVMARSAFGQGTLTVQQQNTLNLAFLAESLDSTFYQIGLETDGLIPSEDRAIWEQITRNELAQRAFLAGVLGSRAAKIPEFDYTAGGLFPDVFSNYEVFTLIAMAFEDFGVRVYKGQAPNLMGNDALLTAALRIHSVEARHAAQIRRLRGLKGWIPFAQPLAENTIDWSIIYGGEENTTHLGIDVSGYEGAEAATEAFDEPVTDVRRVFTAIGLFVVKA